MRDLFSWSFPLGRLFGVTVRVHILFPLVTVALILREAWRTPPPGYILPPGLWIDEVIVAGLLFFIVLAHEFGHVFGARWVDGDAQEILMWPLGGLAYTDVPHTPRANLITTAAGPAVNLLLCILFALLLLVVDHTALQPPWNPLPEGFPMRDINSQVLLKTWSGHAEYFSPYSLPVYLARAFWISYFLFLLNVVLMGFPLDGGRILQAILWRYVGYRQATLTAIYVGFLVVCVVGIYSVVVTSVLAFALTMFIYVSCKNQYILLETGGEEGVFGYDFSQGYTSLERDEPPPKRPRKAGWFQRWLQKRAARKMQLAQETREAEERRMDELLEKVQRQGISALTDEERRFMKRVSDRYRNRN
jgi:stage IV sporulation protein FB